MNVLLYGAGVHNIPLIRSFDKSPFVEKIYITDETSIDCKNYKNVEFITINSVEGCKSFIENKNINLVVIMQTPHYAKYVNIFKYNFLFDIS